jgi:hypothetical protein
MSLYIVLSGGYHEGTEFVIPDECDEWTVARSIIEVVSWDEVAKCPTPPKVARTTYYRTRRLNKDYKVIFSCCPELYE